MNSRRLPRFDSLFLLVALATGRLQADTFTVTRTNNTGPGSLPVIITQANATPGSHTIEFGVSGTILLAAPLPTITNNLTLNGRMDSPVIVSGGTTVPIFSFAAGTTGILSRLTLVDGYSGSGGAAIANAGTLFVSECVITNHNSPGGSGGAINNAGTMTVVSSVVAGNQAASGGAIYNTGVMVIAAATLANNGAVSGNGGAIGSYGFLAVSNATLVGNEAWNGGAISSEGTLSLAHSTVSSNRSTLGFGGGVYSAGASAWIVACTLSANQAIGQQGGNGRGGGGGGAAFGGGLYAMNGVVTITNSTFYANAANGGSGGSDPQSTSSGGKGGGNNGGNGGTNGNNAVAGGFGGGGGGGGRNSPNGNGANGGFGGGGGGAGYSGVGLGGFGGGNGGGSNLPWGGGGGGGAGLGAAMFVENGTVIAVNCTIAANSAVGGSGGPFAANPPPTPGQGIGGGIYNHGGAVSLLNTIVAANLSADSSPDLAGAFASTGFNIIGNSQGASGLSVNDLQNEPANLGPLEDNGGPTLTCSLLQGSLAIGGGTSAGAPPTDQRGIVRPMGQCDIGAFQLITLIVPIITWQKPADIFYGTPLGTAQLNASVGVAGTLTYSPAAGTVLSAGSNQTLTVIFTPSDPSQYTAATNSVAVNVLKANQTITFGPIPNKQIGDPPIVLSASASSGLPVSFSLVSGPANLTGNLLTLGSTNGWITVRASQSGSSNFNPAPDADRSFYLGHIPLPVITAPPTNLTVYPGDRAVLSLVASNGPLSYQWQFHAANIQGEIGPSLVLARVKQDQAGPYRVIVSNSAGSVTSAVATLTVVVTAGTPALTAQPRSTVIRVGESALLSVSATGVAPLRYQWYRGPSGNTNDVVGGATNAAFTASGLTTSTSFWVSVGNSLGAVDSATASVTVLPAKAARLLCSRIAGLGAVTIDGLPGTTYRIESNTGLNSTNWVEVITLSLPTNPYTFIDAGSSGQPRRFYRVVAP